MQETTETIKIGKRTLSLNTLFFALLAVIPLLLITIGILNQPEESFLLDITVGTTSFPVLALVAFVGGMMSFLSPCTLPILPAYFAFAFRGGRTTIIANSFAFLLGLATMFSLLGATASAVGSLLLQNQQVILLIGGSIVILFGTMSLLGQGFGGLQAVSSRERSATLGGSFIFGLTFAVGWTGCIGPILGVVLSLAGTTVSVVSGSILLFIYALGLGLPLMFVSVLFGRSSRDSAVWRALRGRGWTKTVNNRTIALIWAITLWLILIPLLRFALPEVAWQAWPILPVPLAIGRLSLAFTITLPQLLLLGVLILLALIWSRFPANRGTTDVRLHSTQLISGILFIFMGLLLLNNRLTIFNSLASTGLAEQLLDWEQLFLNWLKR